MSYAPTVVMLLCAGLVPGVTLLVLRRPKGLRGAWRHPTQWHAAFREIWRHPELGIVFAFVPDGARRVGLLAAGHRAAYPGLGWAIFTYLTLTCMALAMWSGVVQSARHEARNKLARQRAREYLAKQGIPDEHHQD